MAKYKRRYTHKKHGDEKHVVKQEQEIESLEQRIASETPDRGFTPPLGQQVSFRALALSEATLRGLDGANFVTVTEIQNACIPHALCGRDVLGAARTGSGKTLAFLIPVIEKLFRSRYTPLDGPGGLVLSPTRELAVQIFQVLKKVGQYHSLSAGLVVGGKKEYHVEQQHVGSTNILVATPGRLLQHLEQTPNFDVSNLQILVLDEADRILDMGFRHQMVQILDYLPTERQTLLFSATQTKRVSDLAALSLNKPEYLGVHDKESTATPSNLVQSVVVVPLEHKLNMVYSFIKSHLKHKSIIFLASCSQVRFVWQLFCALQPGIPVMALHGKLVQTKRTSVYFDFVRRPNAVLFATDVAARGLDFTSVDWVLQVDAPEDQDMYIHRVGRTARYNRGGKSLLCVTPQEETGMMELLKKARVPLKKLAMNPTKTVLVTQRAASLVASDQKLQALAKKAFQSYLRSVHLMPNTEIFGMDDLPVDEFAASLGLAFTPNLRFLQKLQDRTQVRQSKNVNHKLQKLKQQIKAEKLAKKIAKLDNKRPMEESNEEEDDLLVIKQRHEWSKEDVDASEGGVHEVTKSRKAKRIKVDRGPDTKNKRIVFDENGQEQDPTTLSLHNNAMHEEKDELLEANQSYVNKVRQRLENSMKQDRDAEKERVREMHAQKRMKAKGARDDQQGSDMMVTLVGEQNDDESTTSSSGVESAGSSESSSSSEDEVEDSDRSVVVKAQQEIALAMIRKGL